jgi:multiple sugar transport system substrate-binding protein
MKNKKIFLALLAALVTLVLLGCNKSGGQAAAAKKELSLWTWKVAMAPGFQAAGDLLGKTSGYSFTVEAFTPDDTYRQKVIGAANSGDLPDLINWWATRSVNFANVLVEFTDVATPEFRSKYSATAFSNSDIRDTDVTNWAKDPEANDVLKSLKAGQLFQIPIDVGGFFTIYANNEILSQVGLQDKVPANFEEFVDFASRVAKQTQYGGFIFAGGLPDVYYNWMGRAVEATYLGAEGSVDLWNRRAKMADPKNIQPLKAYEALVRSGAVMDGCAALNIDQGDAAFAAGDAAYLLGGTFTYGQLQAMGMDVSKVFSFVIPMMKGSAVTEPYGINPFPLTALAIPKSSKNYDAALDYIKYVTQDPAGISAFANGAYIIPAGKLDGSNINLLSTALQDMYNSLADKLSVTTIVDDWPGSVGRRLPHDELYKDMQQILVGTMTAEQAAANYDKNIEAQFASGNL